MLLSFEVNFVGKVNDDDVLSTSRGVLPNSVLTPYFQGMDCHSPPSYPSP